MLHILFLFLKIIGIILAVILGILLLLVCIVLFVPICYKGEAEGTGNLDGIWAHGQIIWLFGLVKIIVDFKDRSLDYSIRIAWKKLGGRPETVGERKEKKEDEEYSKKDEDYNKDKEPEKLEAFEKNEESEALPKIPDQIHQKPEGSNQASEKASGIQEETGTDVEEDAKGKQKSNENEKGKKRISFIEKIKTRFSEISAKIEQIPVKFKCTTEKIYGKIKETSEKKDKITALITDPSHVNALKKGTCEVMKLLRRIAPGTVVADIHYGFEDPSLTGRVLAGLGILYPLLGRHVQIKPDFQETVLEGNVNIKGRIYAVFVAVMAVNMLLNRNVLQTIKDVKKFKL